MINYGSIVTNNYCESDDESLYPCCSYNVRKGKAILCEGNKVKDKNMKYLHRKTEVWPISRSRLTIRNTKLKTLQSIDTFYFEEIIIENNEQLEYINFTTFNESSKLRSLKVLKIINNPSLINIYKDSGSLLELLNRINGSLSNSGGNRWHSVLEITLSNNNLKKIPEKAFEYMGETRLKFRSLNLTSNNIDSIEKYAFSNLPQYEVFDNYFPFISITNDVITTLRSYAFNNISGFNRIDLSNNRIESLETFSFNNLSKIGSINLSNNSIKNLASYSFNNLTKIKLINLSYNSIEILPENGFNEIDGNIDLSYNKIKIIGEFSFNMGVKNFNLDFIYDKDYRRYSTPIFVDFSNNSLKSDAFRENSFNVTNALLIFDSNQLQYLPQETFESFLNLHSNNRMVLRNNEFYCDCRMKWILSKTNPRYNIIGILCSTQEVYIHRLNIDDLNQCI